MAEEKEFLTEDVQALLDRLPEGWTAGQLIKEIIEELNPYEKAVVKGQRLTELLEGKVSDRTYKFISAIKEFKKINANTVLIKPVKAEAIRWEMKLLDVKISPTNNMKIEEVTPEKVKLKLEGFSVGPIDISELTITDAEMKVKAGLITKTIEFKKKEG